MIMNRDIKIVFMGTPEFAVPSLKALYEGGYAIQCVVTQPDRPRGRGRKPRPSPVKAEAERLGLLVLQPEKVNSPLSTEQIRSFAPHFLIVVAYGQILGQGLLDAPSIMPVNVHASLLPRYRGAAPIQWSILNGDPSTGITIMVMDKGMDTGPILVQEEVPIGEEETFGGLYSRLSELGARLLLKALSGVMDGGIHPRPQPEEGASLAPPIGKDLSWIDWSKGSCSIHRKIRALDPRPGAFTTLYGKRVRLFRPFFVDGEPLARQGEVMDPGAVIAFHDTGLIVKTGDGVIGIAEIQWPGKRRMAVTEFLRGHRVSKGTLLGEGSS